MFTLTHTSKIHTCSHSLAQERDDLLASMKELHAASLSRGEELTATTSLLAEERASHKEQLKRVCVELADVRGQLEMQVRHNPQSSQ